MQKYFSSFLFIAKLLILSGAYYVISQRLFNGENFNGNLWTNQIDGLGTAGIAFFVLIVSLTFINWLLEIGKWKFLMSSLQKISFSEALEQSLGSLTASLITPNRIGEYGAKAIYYYRKQRPGVMIRNFIGNATQMTVTAIFGIFGVFVFYDDLPLESFRTSEIYIPLVLITVLLSFLLFWIFQKANRLSWFGKLRSLFKIPNQVYGNALIFSILRYLVFSHQFYLLLLFFDVDIAYTVALPSIFLMYFIASAIPGFVLFDWLVKGSVAVTLFGYLGVSEIVILSITATMWILNFAFPAMIGSIFVIRFSPRTLIPSETKFVK
ncbi:MAG: flippase-like domain-containing protein [Flavobacteriaceae bacterium]|nr:MAG: flippase-like domain-containing protein [Flavobacteriaceae bacterium]